MSEFDTGASRPDAQAEAHASSHAHAVSPGPATPSRGQALRALFVGGLLPVIAFTLIEEYYGVIWGLIAGMVFGVGEVLYEWRTQGKVSGITLGGNAVLLVMGGISLVTQEGVWFKLQPAILEAALALGLFGSVIAGKPMLLAMAQKQGSMPAGIPAEVRVRLEGAMKGSTLRFGLFFAAHAALATCAALHWSTETWAILKGAGLTVSMIVFAGLEAVWMRRAVKRG